MQIDGGLARLRTERVTEELDTLVDERLEVRDRGFGKVRADGRASHAVQVMRDRTEC